MPNIRKLICDTNFQTSQNRKKSRQEESPIAKGSKLTWYTTHSYPYWRPVSIQYYKAAYLSDQREQYNQFLSHKTTREMIEWQLTKSWLVTDLKLSFTAHFSIRSLSVWNWRTCKMFLLIEFQRFKQLYVKLKLYILHYSTSVQSFIFWYYFHFFTLKLHGILFFHLVIT